MHVLGSNLALGTFDKHLDNELVIFYIHALCWRKDKNPKHFYALEQFVGLSID